PVKAGLAHIHGDKAALMLFRGEYPCPGFEGERSLSGLRGERLDNAARAIATGLCLRPITVQDLDVVISACRYRIMDRHDLVEPGNRVRSQDARGIRRDAFSTSAHVGNDDRVAEPIHFRKSRQFSHDYVRSRAGLLSWAATSDHEDPPALPAHSKLYCMPNGTRGSIWRMMTKITSVSA